MISSSQQVLLEAIKASLFGAKFSYPEDTNWDEVVAEAKAQTVMGLISPVIPVHDESAEQCKATYMRIMYEQDRLIRLLDSANIPCVILKGSAAAVYYPKPYLRSMGDIDVLVSREKYHEASELLKDKGYKFTHENERHIGLSKNGVEVELHHHFSSPGYDVDDILEDAIGRREYHDLSRYQIPMLPMIENGLVLLGHINQHIKNNMLGLRQIIDWEMYLYSIKDVVEWENVFLPMAEKIGLLTLANYVTRMCNKYLGLAYCLTMDVDDDLLYELLNVILTDGNLGRREKSSEASVERRVRGTIYGIKRYGFFSFFTGVGLDRLRFAKKKPALKPIAFLCGLFVVLGKGIKALFRNKGVGKQMSEGKKRYELYKKLGVRSGEKD